MKPIAIGIASLLLAATAAVGGTTQGAATTRRAAPGATVKTFDTPQQAAAALIAAADNFDVPALERLFGPSTKTVLLSDEPAQDRQRAAEFVEKAREKEGISIDPKNRARAILLVGNDNWPFPIPLVKRGAKWSFDTAAGRHEILLRRIGADELDAIAISRGYVEAQHEYALKKREGYDVNQYAQRIISTSGTQDGLAWKNADGTWGGPIGEKVAQAIQQGYAAGDPYHG